MFFIKFNETNRVVYVNSLSNKEYFISILHAKVKIKNYIKNFDDYKPFSNKLN